VIVVRAFSYFSLLANIAEDRHHIRRHRAMRREGAKPLASTLRGLFAESQERNTRREDAARAFSRIRVAPVLTAHPTEVQRKSTLDASSRSLRVWARSTAPTCFPRSAKRPRSRSGASSPPSGRRACCAR
jgi:phosphoenolpyruvate carboxylase